MKQKVVTSLIGSLIVIIITIISNEFNAFSSYVYSLVILVALTLMCRINKDFRYNNVFLWTFLTYVIGKVIGVILVYFLFDVSANIPINYSYSYTFTGDIGRFDTFIVRMMKWFMEPDNRGKTLIINIILSLYKGVAVALFAGIIIPGKAKK